MHRIVQEVVRASNGNTGAVQGHAETAVKSLSLSECFEVYKELADDPFQFDTAKFKDYGSVLKAATICALVARVQKNMKARK